METLQNIKLSFKCPKKLNELQPCNGDWYCNGCQKTVYDFRGMDEAQILNAFAKSNYQMCGLFEADRVDVMPTRNKWFKWASAAILASGLTACYDFVFGQTPPVKLDTLAQQRSYALGKIVMPRPGFPGGVEGLNKYLQEQLKLKKGAKGEIIAEVTVEKGGTVSGAKITNSADAKLNAKIINALLHSPKWVWGYGKTTMVLTIDLAAIGKYN